MTRLRTPEFTHRFPSTFIAISTRAPNPFGRFDGRVVESQRGDAAHPTVRERTREGVEVGHFS